MDCNDAESLGSKSFTTSLSDENYHDSLETRNEDNLEYSEEESENIEETGSRNPSFQDLVLNFRNTSTMANFKSDDETSEKLSAVIEQPEDEHRGTDMASKSTESREKSLRQRIEALRELVAALREEWRLESRLWRRESDEYRVLRERSDICALEEATAAARAAAEAYAAESPLSNELGDVVSLDPAQYMSELTILEYEKKLAKYQDASSLAEAEKRYKIRRNLITDTYRRRLMTVERLCNEELENIQKNASSLQPLRQIASQWCLNDQSEALAVQWESGK